MKPFEIGTWPCLQVATKRRAVIWVLVNTCGCHSRCFTPLFSAAFMIFPDLARDQNLVSFRLPMILGQSLWAIPKLDEIGAISIDSWHTKCSVHMLWNQLESWSCRHLCRVVIHLPKPWQKQHPKALGGLLIWEDLEVDLHPNRFQQRNPLKMTGSAQATLPLPPQRRGPGRGWSPFVFGTFWHC